MQTGRMPAEDDARLAQRLQEEFNSSNGSRPKRTAASEAKKRLAEVLFHVLNLKELILEPHAFMPKYEALLCQRRLFNILSSHLAM